MSKEAVFAMTYSAAKGYVLFNFRHNCVSQAKVHTPFVNDYLCRNYPGPVNEIYGKEAKSQPIETQDRRVEPVSSVSFLSSARASSIFGVDYPLDSALLDLNG